MQLYNLACVPCRVAQFLEDERAFESKPKKADCILELYWDRVLLVQFSSVSGSETEHELAENLSCGLIDAHSLQGSHATEQLLMAECLLFQRRRVSSGE